MELDPLAIIDRARKDVPAVDYALGVAGVAAAGAILVALTGNGRATIIIVALVFVGMVLLFLFSSLVGAKAHSVRLAATVMIWAILIFFITFLVFTVGAFAIGQPCNWSQFLNVRSACASPASIGEAQAKPTDIEKLATALKLSTPREAIVTAFGEPAVKVNLQMPWAPEHEDGKPASEADDSYLERKSEAAGMTGELYVFPTLIAEVDYFRGVVVQYGIMLRTRQKIDLKRFSDLRWLPLGGGDPIPPLGDAHFSEFWSQGCSTVLGGYSTSDDWVSVTCDSTKFTDWVQLTIAWQYGGVNENSVAEAFSNVGKYEGRIGADLLGNATGYAADCAPFDPHPLLTLEQAAKELDKTLKSSKQVEGDITNDALLCQSMRMLKPNGFIVSDYNGPYPTVKLPSGNEVVLQPWLMSEGLISDRTFGARRNSYMSWAEQ